MEERLRAELAPLTEEELSVLELELVISRMKNGIKSTHAVKDTYINRKVAERAFGSYKAGRDAHNRTTGSQRRIPEKIELQIRGKSKHLDQIIRSHTLTSYKARVIQLMK